MKDDRRQKLHYGSLYIDVDNYNRWLYYLISCHDNFFEYQVSMNFSLELL